MSEDFEKNNMLPRALEDKVFMDSLPDQLKAAGSKEHYNGEDLVKDVEGEVGFMLEVYDAFKEAMESGAKEIHLLLDIDNTIGAYSQYLEKAEERKFVIRPSLLKLIEDLASQAKEKGIKFDLGLISNRVASHSLEQLKEGGQFESFSKYVNPDLVFSSRGERISDKYHGEQRSEYLRQLGFVKMSNLDDPNRLYEMNPDGYDKLNVLKRLYDQHKEKTAYVVVDDSPIYTELLDKNKNFYGVSLRDKGYYSRA